MTDFLAALMVLMATFIQPANPNSLPTVNTTEFVNRGNQISELAKSLNPPDDGKAGNDQNIFGNSSFNPNFGQSLSHRRFGPTGPTGNSGAEGPTGSSTFRVPAENIMSGITMPHNIPQVAIDHSRALQGSSSGFPLPHGQNTETN